MLRTRVCDLLGIEHPLVAAPMAPNLSDVDLMATVSEAGALGVLLAQLCPPEMLRDKLRELRRRTAKPFGVDLIPEPRRVSRRRFRLAPYAATAVSSRVA